MPRTRPGAPPIPGEATPPNPSPRRPRDHTPNAGPLLRGSPARGLQSRTGPSMIVVLALLAVALIVALVLWATIGRGGRDPSPGRRPPSARPAHLRRVAPVAIDSVVAYDPDGDGEENDELAAAALADGDPSTGWRTVCYARAMMDDKPGVGLALTLATPSSGTLSFDVATAPFQVEVFTSEAAAVPAGFADWGAAIAEKTFSDQAGTVQVGVPAPARHVLIVFRELGRDPGCTPANPYRGTIGEIHFT